MEGCGQLDAAGPAGARSVILTLAFAILLPCACSLSAAGQERVVEEAQQLSAHEKESDFNYGIALAQLGRLDEARGVLQAGQRRWPEDPRFPIELGGVAFKQRRHAEAARLLRRGMRLNPDDAYAADFLATIYFLEGNLEAALKYWNRIGKPRIESVRIQPGLKVDSVLLDRAFTFAPSDTLRLPDLVATRERIAGLGIFPNFTLRLDAREEGRFEATFAARERNGFGNNAVDALLSTFRGVGYQTIYPEYFNVAGSAINVASLVRWDAQNRRLMSSVSGPWAGDAGRRYRIGIDLRDERWDVRRSYEPQPLSLGGFRLRRNAVTGEISFFRSGWSWSTGAELSHRDYRDVSTGPKLPSEVLLKGYALKHLLQVNRQLWRVPDRRFESSVKVSAETATLWSAPSYSFERLQISLASRWFPAMTGDDYAFHQQIRTGKVFGRAPFDELFMLGLERDNDLWLRAHIGARDGRKGSAPQGRDYLLFNWEMDKNVYRNGLFTVKLSPFLDTGGSTNFSGLGSGKWLWDTGMQAKVRVLAVEFVLIYGKDLRSGHNAFYVTARR